MRRMGNKRGFTLAELLIVMAIIAILVSIAIPTFTAQLEGARIAVDRSNARAASSLAYSEYVLYHTADSGAGGAITYRFGSDPEGNLFILSHADAEGGELEDVDASDGAELQARSKRVGSKPLTVVVDDGRIAENSWLAALDAS